MKQLMLSKKIQQLGVLALVSVVAVGCNRGIKPEVHEPVRLVQLAESQTLLQPVFTANMGAERRSRDPLDLRVGYSSQQMVLASRSGAVQGYDGAGNRIWSITLNEAITGGVSLDAASETAVVSTQSGKVVALNSSTGQVRWQKQLPATVLSSALIHNNRVVVFANNGFLHGLSLQSGQSIWQFATQVPNISIRGSATPTLLDDNTVLMAAADGRLHAVALDTGIPQWSRRVARAAGASEIARMADIDATPVVVDNHIYSISYSGQLLGIRLDSPEMFEQEVASLKSVAVLGNSLISTSLDGTVAAFDRSTGRPLWSSDALKYRQLTNPVVIGNHIAVGDLAGVVHLFEPQQGQIVSRVQSRGALTSLQARGAHLMTQSQTGQVNVWRLLSSAR